MSDIPVQGSTDHPVSLDPWHRIVEVGWPGIIPVVFEFSGFSDRGFGFLDGFDAGLHSTAIEDGAIDKDLYKDFTEWTSVPVDTPGAISEWLDNHYTVDTSAPPPGPGDIFFAGEWFKPVPETIVSASEKLCGILNFKHINGRVRLFIQNHFIDLSSGNVLVPDKQLVAVYPYSVNYSLRRYPSGAAFTHHADRTITTDATPIWTKTGTLTGQASTDASDPARNGQALDFDKDGNFADVASGWS